MENRERVNGVDENEREIKFGKKPQNKKKKKSEMSMNNGESVIGLLVCRADHEAQAMEPDQKPYFYYNSYEQLLVQLELTKYTTFLHSHASICATMNLKQRH